MSYQVIARKYRPQRFADVVGQEHVTLTLAHAIEQNRIAHAYLFCGPRGTGKTTIARIFAKCLRCVNAPTTTPCDACAECRAIMAGNSMDMLEFDAASHTQVDKIRDLVIDHVKYAPATGKVKLYLIDEVHMLSASSFNALLKTLEEPPDYVKFLFATTDPEKLPATILSRCQRFDLRRIPAALIVQHLKLIAGKENVKVDEPALFAIARGADGGMRDAESTLDQLISFCGDRIEESDVLSMFGLTAQAQILELSRAILAGEIPTALGQLNQLAQHGKDLGRLLADLLSHFRNLLIYRVARGDLNLLEVSEAEAAALKDQAALADPETFTRLLEVLADAEIRLRDAASKKILLEITLLKAIEARNAVNLDAVLKQLNALRGGTTPGAGASARAASPPAGTRSSASAASPPSRAPDEPSRLAPQSSLPAAPAEPAGGAGDLHQLWAQLTEAVGRVSPFTRTYLVDAHPVSFAGGVFTIGFDPEFSDQLGLVDNPRNHTLLQTKLAELGHPNAQIKFVTAEPPAGRAPVAAARSAAPPPGEKAVAAPFNQDEFKNDPLIQKALEIFKGQIVEVRA
jgi:DNA polymerase-3 subunit gamma/tau